jgi:penicillin-binding protein 1C
MRNTISITIFTVLLTTTLLLWWQTTTHLLPPPQILSVANSQVRKVQILDRHATPLTITYQNNWNIYDYVPLHDIPELLQKIFVIAEDKRFFQHHGTDWRARWSAIFQNVKTLRKVRGASTITEQTVRMLYPRPRNAWSRWLEGLEAARLEDHFAKTEILEFYLNQVPYASQRRGVVQAARYYFDRDLDTLNLKEMMALAVLVRAPSRLDLRKGTIAIEAPLQRLAPRLLNLGIITHNDYQTVLTTPLQLRESQLPVKATHFVQYIYASQPPNYLQTLGRLPTTLDGNLQRTVQDILDRRLHDLRNKGVHNGAVLIVDHRTNEVLAWINGGAISPNVPGNEIDAVTTPRQPGSTLKPLLYALALEKGWTAATLIDDAPLVMPVGTGMHNYRNYSRQYYGPSRLRDALGNSLNTPAVRTIQFVGAATFLQRLRQLGVTSLTADSTFYGDGLALGNGDLTLLELVQAYSALANQGLFRPLQVLKNAPASTSVRVFSKEITAIIADILSDPEARSLEFGRGALLTFPVQTAVKTGTSTDYRDAWAVGFNHRYLVGVWLGNLDQQAMSSVSGSSGAALVLRAIFAELNRFAETKGLYLSPELVKVDICRTTGLRAISDSDCPSRYEWFLPGTAPSPTTSPPVPITIDKPLHLKQPNDGLQLAMDPRIPDDHEAFALILSDSPLNEKDSVQWLMDDEVIGTTPAKIRQFLWPVKRGTHNAQARIQQPGSDQLLVTPAVTFYVK